MTELEAKVEFLEMMLKSAIANLILIERHTPKIKRSMDEFVGISNVVDKMFSREKKILYEAAEVKIDIPVVDK